MKNTFACPLSGLREAVAENKKIVKYTPEHSFTLSSLACVFDEVVKSNTNGKPFLLKDMVMLDVRFRDWKRLLPRIEPVYGVKANNDAQILAQLAKLNVAFFCSTTEEYKMVAENPEARVTGDYSDLSKGILVVRDGNINQLSVSSETSILLQLKVGSASGITAEQVVPTLTLAKSKGLRVDGFSIAEIPIFGERSYREALIIAREAIAVCRFAGFTVDVLDLGSEVKLHTDCQQTFEKNSKTLTKLVNELIPAAITVRVRASTYFAEACHFLFTKIDNKQVTESGETEYHVDWPLASALPKHVKPVPCSPASTRKGRTHARLVYEAAADKDTALIMDDYPELDAGEWVYWPNVNLGIGKTVTGLPEQSYDVFRFEGPEKKLELHFKPIPGNPRGLRDIEKSTWDEILALSHISILSIKGNDHFDAYLLSESSLFVYPYKLYLKTCGISSPLLCTPALADLADKLNTILERVLYSRRNFLFPVSQCYPHRSMEEEEGYLKQFFPTGQAINLGKREDPDNWLLFEAILSQTASPAISREYLPVTPSFEITMTGKLLSSTMQNFWATNNGLLQRNPGELKIAEKTGIAQLIDGVEIDEYAFSPCGFSLNGLKDDGFVTIHITPQDEFAYVSYETNIANLDLHKLRDGILQIFRPEKFTMLITNSLATSTDLADTEYLLTNRTDTLLNGLPVFFESCQRTDCMISEPADISPNSKKMLHNLLTHSGPCAMYMPPVLALEETWS